MTSVDLEIAIVAKHYGQSPFAIEKWPYTRFLRYQEAMYLANELERQQIDNVSINDDGGRTTMYIGGGEKFLKTQPRIPEPKEYTIPQPHFVNR